VQNSLIRQLAVRREPTGDPLVYRYDVREQISYIWESDSWIASNVSSVVAQTKKADQETGEDQKSV
jgi:hypothetical protein